jgi:hypothetical protein
MTMNTWQATLMSHRGDGTALTAAAAASLLQGATATRAKYTFPADFWSVNTKIKVKASGRISCAVTTPGTARFDFRLGGTVVWDSLAINLNIVAKTNVHWALEADLFVQAEGDSTTTTLFPGQCIWTSEALIGSPLPTVGGSGSVPLPYNTPPVVGAGFNGKASQQFDLFFTQTVATGSITLHTLNIDAMN